MVIHLIGAEANPLVSGWNKKLIIEMFIYYNLF